MTEKLEYIHVFHFLIDETNPIHERLFFKTVTFTEKGSVFNKQLTFIRPMYAVVRSFVNSAVSQLLQAL